MIGETLAMTREKIPVQGCVWTGVITSGVRRIVSTGLAAIAHAADELVTFTNWGMGAPGGNSPAWGNTFPSWGRVSFNTTPAPANATATGTAAWYAMYDHPTAPVHWLIGTASLVSGGATLMLDDLSLTNGQPVTIINWGFSFD